MSALQSFSKFYACSQIFSVLLGQPLSSQKTIQVTYTNSYSFSNSFFGQVSMTADWPPAYSWSKLDCSIFLKLIFEAINTSNFFVIHHITLLCSLSYLSFDTLIIKPTWKTPWQQSLSHEWLTPCSSTPCRGSTGRRHLKNTAGGNHWQLWKQWFLFESNAQPQCLKKRSGHEASGNTSYSPKDLSSVTRYHKNK